MHAGDAVYWSLLTPAEALTSCSHASFQGLLLTRGHLRHLALFIRLATTDGTLPYFIFEHRIIAGAGTSKFIARKNMANVDEDKRNGEKAKDDGQHI